MSEQKRSGAGCLIAAIIWIIIVGVLAVAARYLILPYFEKEKKEELLETTSSSREFTHTVRLLADSFSGYAILRSTELRKELETNDIGLITRDDQADTRGRIEALRDGKAQMAVFTVDSFIANGAAIGQFPASIVMVLDESMGADALISHKAGVESIQDLDSPDARIVLTQNSPSEFLARAVLANFYLPKLPKQWSEAADGSADVYQRFRRGSKNAKKAYALWEPHVSMALRESGAQLLLDSSKLKGYIVDVLVAERNFLRDHPDVVRQVVEAYLRIAYRVRQEPNGLTQLIKSDARDTGMEALDDKSAEALAEKIEWRNTLENYAFFDLLSATEQKDAVTADEAIGNIMEVLVKTGALNSDPLDGQYGQLYYDGVLKGIKDSGFHPGKALNLIQGVGPSPSGMEGVRQRAELRALTENEWKSLEPVGELRIDPISFGRGSARINIQSRRDMDDLARRLEAWPDYYLVIVGHTRSEGDRDANLKLGSQRAHAALDYLKSLGVNPNRMQSRVGPPSQDNGSAQSVTFRLGEFHTSDGRNIHFLSSGIDTMAVMESGRSDAINREELNRRTTIAHLAYPLFLWPLMSGFTGLMGLWALGIRSGPMIFAGLACILGSLGGYATRWFLSDARIREKVMNQMRREIEEQREESLNQLYQRLRRDRDERTERCLKDLCVLAEAFKKDDSLLTGLNERSRFDILSGVEKLFQRSVSSLEKSLDLFNMARRISTKEARRPILEQRERLVRDVTESVEQLGKVLSSLQREKSEVASNVETDMSALREELDRSLEVARKVDERMRGLEGVIDRKLE